MTEGSRASARSARSRVYLERLGIPVWVRRGPSVVPGELADAGETSAADGVPAVGTDEAPAAGWHELEVLVASCRACDLHEGARKTAVGADHIDARLMFIGGAADQREDATGEPFFGDAGQLLNAMLASIGLQREDVFIADSVKSRPAHHRDPQRAETASSRPYLAGQIEAVRPALLIALGQVSAQCLLETKAPLGKLRGTVHRYGDLGLPLMVTYHPAYLLRSPAEKRASWEDLKRIKTFLGGHADG
ncbi:MAG: uracil-DNA glycosylase [Pseudomonadota bacterium]